MGREKNCIDIPPVLRTTNMVMEKILTHDWAKGKMDIHHTSYPTTESKTTNDGY